MILTKLINNSGPAPAFLQRTHAELEGLMLAPVSELILD